MEAQQKQSGMLAGLVLLMLGAAASNRTEELVVSSAPLRVAAPQGPAQEHPAQVRPIPRSAGLQEARGMKQMRKTFKKWMPYLFVPTMMALGYAPFVLASLKMMVMNAVSLNMMAFNAAIFLTLRNMVFGPRNGQHVKYFNFGYSHKKKPYHDKHPH